MATTQTPHRTSLQVLRDQAVRLRIDSVRSTTDFVAVLFYSVMRFDRKEPHRPGSDVFVLSKGHAALLLYSAWAEAGAFPARQLLRLRTIDSDLEGHPGPRLPFVDVATAAPFASLGVCFARLQPIDQRELVAAGNIVITVEDHYEHGGIGDAVFGALASEGVRGRKLAVREIPRSGNAQELLEKFGIDAEHIVAAVKACLA